MSEICIGIACNAQVADILDRQERDGQLERGPVPILFAWKTPRIIDNRLPLNGSEIYYSMTAWIDRVKEQNEWEEKINEAMTQPTERPSAL